MGTRKTGPVLRLSRYVNGRVLSSLFPWFTRPTSRPRDWALPAWSRMVARCDHLDRSAIASPMVQAPERRSKLDSSIMHRCYVSCGPTQVAGPFA